METIGIVRLPYADPRLARGLPLALTRFQCLKLGSGKPWNGSLRGRGLQEFGRRLLTSCNMGCL